SHPHTVLSASAAEHQASPTGARRGCLSSYSRVGRHSVSDRKRAVGGRICRALPATDGSRNLGLGGAHGSFPATFQCAGLLGPAACDPFDPYGYGATLLRLTRR